MSSAKQQEVSVADLFKEGLKRALKIHIPFILYLIFLLFGVMLFGISLINTTLGFGAQGYIVLLLLIVVPGILVGFLAWLGAKYKYY